MNEIEMAVDAIGTALAQEPPAAIEQGCGFYLVIEDALATALVALREKLERENGCEYCKVLTPDCCGGFFLPSIDPDCEADMVTISHCPMCGKRLEVEP